MNNVTVQLRQEFENSLETQDFTPFYDKVQTYIDQTVEGKVETLKDCVVNKNLNDLYKRRDDQEFLNDIGKMFLNKEAIIEIEDYTKNLAELVDPSGLAIGETSHDDGITELGEPNEDENESFTYPREKYDYTIDYKRIMVEQIGVDSESVEQLFSALPKFNQKHALPDCRVIVKKKSKMIRRKGEYVFKNTNEVYIFVLNPINLEALRIMSNIDLGIKLHKSNVFYVLDPLPYYLGMDFIPIHEYNRDKLSRNYLILLFSDDACIAPYFLNRNLWLTGADIRSVNKMMIQLRNQKKFAHTGARSGDTEHIIKLNFSSVISKNDKRLRDMEFVKMIYDGRS